MRAARRLEGGCNPGAEKSAPKNTPKAFWSVPQVKQKTKEDSMPDMIE
jgi:hypothetical protein